MVAAAGRRLARATRARARRLLGDAARLHRQGLRGSLRRAGPGTTSSCTTSRRRSRCGRRSRAGISARRTSSATRRSTACPTPTARSCGTRSGLALHEAYEFHVTAQSAQLQVERSREDKLALAGDAARCARPRAAAGNGSRSRSCPMPTSASSSRPRRRFRRPTAFASCAPAGSDFVGLKSGPSSFGSPAPSAASS